MVNEKEHDDQEEKERPYSFYEQKATMRALHFYISGVIDDPKLYTDMIHQIRIATPQDAIHIHLNTPGGQIATGVQIINAIRGSQGKVTTHLEGEVCSMGSMLFLAGHEMVCYDNCVMMFHNYSGGNYGKGHELTAALEATNKWINTLMVDVCYPFLSHEELDRIIRGEDLWMQSEEIGTRLVAMTEELQKEADLAKAAEEEAKSAPKKKTPRKKRTTKS